MNVGRMSDSELYAEAENLRRRINGKHVGDDVGQSKLERRLKAIENEVQIRDRRSNHIN